MCSKWFAKALGNEGLYKLLDGFNDKSCYVKTIFGYCDGEVTKLFEGVTHGMMVAPRG